MPGASGVEQGMEAAVRGGGVVADRAVDQAPLQDPDDDRDEVEVVAEAHPDSTDTTGKWECVDIAPVRPFTRPVSMAEIKAEPRLAQMVLVNNSRLSVQPVTPEEWAVVCETGETEAG